MFRSNAMMLTWMEAAAAGPAICGGKGYNLGRLARYGFRVPDGGVLPAEACRLTRAQQPSPALPDSVRQAVCDFLERHGLSNAPLAVRSSATAEDSAKASFAGIHRSILNVRGMDAVERAILACYESLWTPHAIAYRQRFGFADYDVDCAVVICRMVAREGHEEPLCAGVAFSADPLTGRRDLIVIEAAAGLADGLVSGRINPERSVFRIDHVVPVREQVHSTLLSDQQLEELARTVHRIHWALGEGQDPQDIEWAHDGEHLWIVQARPITRLPRAAPPSLLRLPQYWSTGNIKDSVPGVVCELSWSSLEASVQTVAFEALAAAEYPVPPGLELVRRFHGRIYFDFTLMQWLFCDAFGLTPEEILRSIGGHHPEIEIPAGDPLKGPEGSRRRKAGLRLLRALWGFEEKNEPYLTREIAEVRSTASGDLSAEPADSLRKLFRTLRHRGMKIERTAGLANSAGGRWHKPLEALLNRTLGTRGPAVMTGLLSGSGAITSAEQGYAISDLTRIARNDADALRWLGASPAALSWTELPAGSPFRRGFAAFLDRFGHRASQDANVAVPRWVEDPAPLVRQIQEQLALGELPDARISARARRLEAEKEARQKAALLWPVIRWLANKLRRSYAARELGKSALVSTILPCRRIVLEIGRRLVAAGHLERVESIFDFSAIDLMAWLEGNWDGRGAEELTADRRLRREVWLKEEEPDVIAGEGAVIPADVPVTQANGGWRGTAVSSGQATGPARVVLSPVDGSKLAPGEVLVAPSTDPGWTPLFLRASAIVMESGGYLSHGAIVAREYGLPAVVNVPGLLREVHDGDVLAVNGDDGTVRRL